MLFFHLNTGSEEVTITCRGDGRTGSSRSKDPREVSILYANQEPKIITHVATQTFTLLLLLLLLLRGPSGLLIIYTSENLRDKRVC